VDSEKPKHDPPSDKSQDDDAVRRRVERLTSSDRPGRDRRPASPDVPAPGQQQGPAGRESGAERDSGSGPASSGDPGRSAGKPRLTERQRREAREKRRQERRGGGRTRRGRGSSGTGPRGPSGNPLSRGLRATWLELRRTAVFAWGLLLGGLDRLGPAVRAVTAALVALLAATGRGLAGVGRAARAALSRTGSLVLALDRMLTPRRALVAVAAAGAAALVVSQFTDFRATEIGREAYDPILDIARAPRTDVLTPTGAHSVALLLAAAAAIAGIVGTAVTGRRAYAMAVLLAGAATIAVTLLVDLPKGLDVGEAEISYSEATAVLLSGFWIQLGAGLVLAVGGLGLLVSAGARRRTAVDAGTGTRRGRNPHGGRPRSAGAGGVS